MKQLFLGAEFLTNMENPKAILHKFSRQGPAIRWLKSFDAKQVGSDILVRAVLTMPIGWRERTDIVKTYMQSALNPTGARTWQDARFLCAWDYAINKTMEKKVIEAVKAAMDKVERENKG